MFKQLFCKHKENQEVICWHFTHGDNGIEPRFIEVQYKCHRCGKYYYRNITDTNEMMNFVSTYPDKEFSEKCKPVQVSKQIFYS